jgi:hypothetical protein
LKIKYGATSASTPAAQITMATEPTIPELIPILHTSSAARAVEWYAKLGFTKDWEHRFEPTLPAFVQISNGGMKIFLSEHKGDARPDTLLYLRVADVDEFVKDLWEDGEGKKVEIEVEEGRRVREVELKDLDGNRLRIETPLD